MILDIIFLVFILGCLVFLYFDIKRGWKAHKEKWDMIKKWEAETDKEFWDIVNSSKHKKEIIKAIKK